MPVQKLSKSLQAKVEIQFAIARLVDKYPFHARILEQFQLGCQEEVGTMAVAARDTGISLLFNSNFVLAISSRELLGVLLHEVHHVVFGHVTANPDDFPDHWALTVAEEVTVNEYVREPLPSGCITLDQFPSLPRMESTKQRYDRLVQHRDRPSIQSADLELWLSDQPSVTKSGRGNKRSPKKSDKNAVGSDKIMTLDNHDTWLESGTDRHEAEAAIQEILLNAALEAGASNIPRSLVPALESCGIGHDSGDGILVLDDGDRGRLDWKRLLRRYVGRRLTPKPDFRWPSRRFPDLAGVVPGRRRQLDRPHIMAVIDTSASVTDEQLLDINGELARLARDFRVSVVECDSVIQRIYPYTKIGSVHGRGGTDFRPPLEPAFLRKHRPDLIVYFSDGDGPAPRRKPKIPVIWCLTPGGHPPVTWGRVIEMD